MELPDNQTPIDKLPAEALQAKADVSYVMLRVDGPGADPLDFRVKMTTPMAKVKHAYTKQRGLVASGLRFIFDGNEVNDEDTPQKLKMEDGDVIEFSLSPFRRSLPLVSTSVAKLPAAIPPKTSAVPPAPEVQKAQAQDSCIKLKIAGREFSGGVMQFRLKMTDSLGKVKQAYATRLGLTASALRFVFDGHLVSDEETPHQLKMKDDGVINVYQNQPYLYNPGLASPLNKLPAEILHKIFAQLPLKQRVKLGRTSKQFLAASHETTTKFSNRNWWSETWPGNIEKLLRSCPKMAEICVYGSSIYINESQHIPPPVFENLSSLKLYDVTFDPRARKRRRFESTMTRYFERFPNLEELLWHHVTTSRQYGSGARRDLAAAARLNMPAELCNSLRKVALVNPEPRIDEMGPDHWSSQIAFNAALHQMPNLECLYLGGSLCCFDHARCTEADHFWESFLYGLGTLSNLRELCLADPDLRLVKHPDAFRLDLEQLAVVICEKLPKLEVLIFAAGFRVEPAGIARLITANTALRILVILGAEASFGKYAKKGGVPFVVPPRSLAQATTLQVFIGGKITRTVRFTQQKDGAVKFWVVDCELPQFLVKPDVAKVFEGVWLAKVLLEMPTGSREGQPWNRSGLCNSSPLQFYA